MPERARLPWSSPSTTARSSIIPSGTSDPRRSCSVGPSGSPAVGGGARVRVAGNCRPTGRSCAGSACRWWWRPAAWTTNGSPRRSTVPAPTTTCCVGSGSDRLGASWCSSARSSHARSLQVLVQAFDRVAAGAPRCPAGDRRTAAGGPTSSLGCSRRPPSRPDRPDRVCARARGPHALAPARRSSPTQRWRKGTDFRPRGVGLSRAAGDGRGGPLWRSGAGKRPSSSSAATWWVLPKRCDVALSGDDPDAGTGRRSGVRGWRPVQGTTTRR